MRKGAWLLTVAALVLLLVVGAGVVGCLTESSEVSTDTKFTIQVSGTMGLQYEGSYLGFDGKGQSASRSVSGAVPSRYTVRGTMVSAAFNKQSQSGTLTVEIFEGGKRVAYSTTHAPYGVVSVSFIRE